MKCEVLAIYPISDSDMKIARIKAQAFVENDLKCEARFSVVIVKKEEFDKKYKRR
jgi:hypothetical protein